MKKLIAITAAVAALAGCSSDADIASRNMSKAADQFEVTRRVVFYNGISLYHLRTAGLVVLQPYELAITELLKPVRYMLRHYVGVYVYFQG